MASMAVGLSGLMGLVIGSQLTTVIMRLPYRQSLRAAARCPACDIKIRRRDQIPVISWLLLRGRCRHCQAELGWRYPVVELLTAGLFVLLVWRFDPSLPLVAFLYLAAVGVALAVIDLDLHRLPDALTLPSYGVIAALFTSACLVAGHWAPLLRSLVGMVILFGLYWLIALIAPEGMGFGDVKLAGVLGLVLGWVGWSAVLMGTVFAFGYGGVVSLVLLSLGWAKRDTQIAFGPFMLAGALTALLLS